MTASAPTCSTERCVRKVAHSAVCGLRHTYSDRDTGWVAAGRRSPDRRSRGGDDDGQGAGLGPDRTVGRPVGRWACAAVDRGRLGRRVAALPGRHLRHRCVRPAQLVAQAPAPVRHPTGAQRARCLRPGRAGTGRGAQWAQRLRRAAPSSAAHPAAPPRRAAHRGAWPDRASRPGCRASTGPAEAAERPTPERGVEQPETVEGTEAAEGAARADGGAGHPATHPRHGTGQSAARPRRGPALRAPGPAAPDRRTATARRPPGRSFGVGGGVGGAASGGASDGGVACGGVFGVGWSGESGCGGGGGGAVGVGASGSAAFAGGASDCGVVVEGWGGEDDGVGGVGFDAGGVSG